MRNNTLHTAAVLVAALAILTSTAGLAFAADKDVIVVNTAVQPVPTSEQGTVSIKDVDHPARQPFAGLKIVSLTDGEQQDFTEFDPVPAGKRLVIETVTLRAVAVAGQIWDVTIFVTSNGLMTGHTLALSTFQTLGDIDIRTATLAVRLYADPGTQVKVQALRQYGTVGLAGVAVSLSGHHVDVP